MAAAAGWDLKSGTHRFGRRTNALAFSKYDCHTCAASKTKCDRRRPFCGNCQSSNRDCGGFALDLVWKDSLASSQRNARLDSSRDLDHAEGPQHGEQKTARTSRRPFRFVQDRPPRKGLRGAHRNNNDDSAHQSNGLLNRHGQPVPPEITTSPIHLTTATPLEPVEVDYTELHENGIDLFSSYQGHNARLGPVVQPGSPAQAYPMCIIPTEADTRRLADHSMGPHARPWINPPCDTGIGLESCPPMTDSGSQNNIVATDIDDMSVSFEPGNLMACCPSHCIDDIKDYGSGPLSGVPPGVKFRNLAQKYSSMLSIFNEEFCVIPLSTDCRHNPFRARTDLAERFPFLLHAIIAMTSHHLARKHNNADMQRESFNHWSVAVQSFRVSLPYAAFWPLLDTILLLINFESSQSVFGMLDMHLQGALALLQQYKVPQYFYQSSRLRAQLAMLIWWDVTSSLVAFHKPRLANTYLQLLSPYDETDGWSFITLNGCPTSFVIAMGQLSELAERHMRSHCGDALGLGELDAIIDSVKEFSFELSEETKSIDVDEEDPARRQHRAYCVEAWRHAILLYASRVFASQHDAKRHCHRKHHVRVILDSVLCIPPTEPFQKQLLLPVFLAGAEVSDEFNQTFVRQYCQHWRSMSHFDQFSGAQSLLNDIWRKDTCWWDIKARHTLGGAEGQNSAKQILLG